ncbi:hypothetical protein QUB68_25010 [Microcoleus sp. A006_D1]
MALFQIGNAMNVLIELNGARIVQATEIDFNAIGVPVGWYFWQFALGDVEQLGFCETYDLAAKQLMEFVCSLQD